MYSNLDSKSRYFFDDVLRETRLIGPWLKAQDKIQYAEDYLHNTGMDWSDIKYHKLDIGVGAAVGSTVNFVSSNVMRLYNKKGSEKK